MTPVILGSSAKSGVAQFTRMNDNNPVGFAAFRMDSVKFSTCLFGPSLYCGWCGRSFHCTNELKNHCLTKHLSTCACGRKFGDDESLLDHVQKAGCYLPLSNPMLFFDDGSAAAASANGRSDSNSAGKRPVVLQRQRDRLQSANADGCETACIKERAQLDRDRSVESPLADRRKHSSLSHVAKPAMGGQNEKDEESPAEYRFLRSCFSSMFGGLMRCRLCSHVYAQWHTAYMHVRSAHSEELTKWRNGKCKSSYFDTPAGSKELRKSPDAQSNGTLTRKHEGVKVMSTKKAKCKQKNDSPEATRSQINNILLSNQNDPEEPSGDRETSGASRNIRLCEKKQRRNPCGTVDKLGNVGRTSVAKFCHVCRSTYSNLSAYLRHLSLPGRCCDAFGYVTSQCQKLSDGRAECRLCGEVLHTRSRVYTHIRQMHGIPDVIPLIGRKPENRPGAAADDDGIGVGSATSDCHAKAHIPRCPPQLTCLMCHRTFKSRSSLQRHKIVCRYHSTWKGRRSVDFVTPAEHVENGDSADHEISSGTDAGRQTRNPVTASGSENAKSRSTWSLSGCVQLGKCRRFKCKVCNAVYGRRHHVRRHAQNSHPELWQKFKHQSDELIAEAKNSTASATKTADGAKPRRFSSSLRALGVTCIKCGYTFESRSIYLRHQARCTGKKIRRNGSARELVYLAGKCQRLSDGRTACRLCGKSATRHCDIYRHIRDKHGIPDDIAGSDGSKHVESGTVDQVENTAT